MSGEQATVAELEEQVKMYTEQLADVNAALAADADNAELREVHASLVDVLQLTTELLVAARAQQKALIAAAQAAASTFFASTAAVVAAAAAESHASSTTTTRTHSTTTTTTTTTAIVPHPSLSILPTSTSSATTLAPGVACKAVWSGDGELYDATVKRLLPNGDVVVQYAGYTDEVTLKRDLVRLDDAAARQASPSGGAAKKRKAAEDPYAEQPIPASLTILPSDSAEERERKRKRVKSIKSANRLKRLEKEKNESASSWQKFINKKASTKAVSGFSTGKKAKKSMFATPDTIDGKVGVINSGQGVTESVDRKTFRIRPSTEQRQGSDDDDDEHDSE